MHRDDEQARVPYCPPPGGPEDTSCSLSAAQMYLVSSVPNVIKFVRGIHIIAGHLVGGSVMSCL